MPKLYFYDTGLACSLLGLEKDPQLENHYLKGALFENWVILEILKGRTNRGLPPNLYFWRDQTGHGVDLIGEWGGKIHGVEIKFGSTLQDQYLKNLNYFIDLTKSDKRFAVEGYLVYGGDQMGTYTGVALTPTDQIGPRFFPPSL
jgi:predicted AAA+ superfamily ATPase